MTFRLVFTLGLASTLFLGGVAGAQQRSNDDPCRDAGWDDEYYRSCEVRDYTLAAGHGRGANSVCSSCGSNCCSKLAAGSEASASVLEVMSRTT